MRKDVGIIILKTKNKKRLGSNLQVALLSVGSLVAVAIMIDITSGLYGGLGIISFSSLIIIPALFAVPIIIKELKLLFIPIILLPLFIAIIGFVLFHPSDRLGNIMLFCVVSAAFALVGVIVGTIIRSIRSKIIRIRIVATAIGIIVLTIISVSVFNYISNPLLHSKNTIRKNIFELTPIGTSKDEVITLIDTNAQWRNKKYSDFYQRQFKGNYQHFDYGYAIKDDRLMIRYHGDRYDDSEMIGVETLMAPIGTYTDFSYGLPFDTTVYVYWAFDGNSNLVDIAITKDTDVL